MYTCTSTAVQVYTLGRLGRLFFIWQEPRRRQGISCICFRVPIVYSTINNMYCRREWPVARQIPLCSSGFTQPTACWIRSSAFRCRAQENLTLLSQLCGLRVYSSTAVSRVQRLPPTNEHTSTLRTGSPAYLHPSPLPLLLHACRSPGTWNTRRGARGVESRLTFINVLQL